MIKLFKAKKSKGTHPSMTGKVPVKKKSFNPKTGQWYYITFYVNPDKAKNKTIIQEQHPDFFVNKNVEVKKDSKIGKAIYELQHVKNEAEFNKLFDTLSTDDLKTTMVKVEDPYIRDRITQKLYNERYDENFFKLLTNENLEKPSKEEVAEVQEMINNQILKTHTDQKFQIAGIFKVKESPNIKRFEEFNKKKDNLHENLWHGTHHDAFDNIIKEGFKVAYTKSGRALGDGVYFAPQASKSIQYCSNGFRSHDGGVLILGDCAYGKRKNGGRLTSGGTEDTVYLKGGGRFMYDELCVRDPAQYKMKYAVLINKRIYQKHIPAWEKKDILEAVTAVSHLAIYTSKAVQGYGDVSGGDLFKQGLKKLNIDIYQFFDEYSKFVKQNPTWQYTDSQRLETQITDTIRDEIAKYDKLSKDEKLKLMVFGKDYLSNRNIKNELFTKVSNDVEFMKEAIADLNVNDGKQMMLMAPIIAGFTDNASSNGFDKVNKEILNILIEKTKSLTYEELSRFLGLISRESRVGSNSDDTLAQLSYRAISGFSPVDFDAFMKAVKGRVGQRFNNSVLTLKYILEGDPNDDSWNATKSALTSGNYGYKDKLVEAYLDGDMDTFKTIGNVVTAGGDSDLTVMASSLDHTAVDLLTEKIEAIKKGDTSGGHRWSEGELIHGLYAPSSSSYDDKRFVNAGFKAMNEKQKDEVVMLIGGKMMKVDADNNKKYISINANDSLDTSTLNEIIKRLPDDAKNSIINLNIVPNGRTVYSKGDVKEIVAKIGEIGKGFTNKDVILSGSAQHRNMDNADYIYMHNSVKEQGFRLLGFAGGYGPPQPHAQQLIRWIANGTYDPHKKFNIPSFGGFRNLQQNTGGARPLSPKYYKNDTAVRASTSKAFQKYKNYAGQLIDERIYERVQASDGQVSQEERNKYFNQVGALAQMFTDAIYTGALDDTEVIAGMQDAFKSYGKSKGRPLTKEEKVKYFGLTFSPTDMNRQFESAKANRLKKIMEKLGIA